MKLKIIYNWFVKKIKKKKKKKKKKSYLKFK